MSSVKVTKIGKSEFLLFGENFMIPINKIKKIDLNPESQAINSIIIHLINGEEEYINTEYIEDFKDFISKNEI